jgi:hypothetical protein
MLTKMVTHRAKKGGRVKWMGIRSLAEYIMKTPEDYPESLHDFAAHPVLYHFIKKNVAPINASINA